jgi:hypothetical protein
MISLVKTYDIEKKYELKKKSTKKRYYDKLETVPYIGKGKKGT